MNDTIDNTEKRGIIKSFEKISELRYNENHDPNSGQFTSDVSAFGTNEFEKGFSEHNLNEHWTGRKSDHSVQYPNFTKEQYAVRALELVQSETDGVNILGYKTPNGQVVRYDVRTNDYVKGKPNKGIATMFKPKRKQQYFEEWKSTESEE